MVGAININARTIALTLFAVTLTTVACTNSEPSTAPSGIPAATGAVPTGAVTREIVCAREEASLTYPGATAVKEFGAGAQGLNDAFCGHTITTPDDQDKVYAWYSDWLTAHGYQHYSDVSGGSYVSARSFERPPNCREYITIGTVDPTTYKTIGVPPPVIPSGTRTVFEYSYSIGSNDSPACHPSTPIKPAPPTSRPLISTG